jgi:hypothetical protein
MVPHSVLNILPAHKIIISSSPYFKAQVRQQNNSSRCRGSIHGAAEVVLLEVNTNVHGIVQSER